MEAIPLNATLESRRDLDDRHTLFTVRPDHPLAFAPGQWTELGLPRREGHRPGPEGGEFEVGGVVRRAYTIIGRPGEPTFRAFFNRVEGGQLTPWLWRLAPGERLYANPEAKGHFTFEGLRGGRDLLLVGGGTGIAPFASLLAAHAGSGRYRRAALLHSARVRTLLAFEEELRTTAEADPALRYLPSLTREPAGNGWQGLRGRLPGLFEEREEIEARVGFPLDPASTEVYLCGSTGLIQGVEDRLMAWGFQPRWLDPSGTIHTEIYY
jgi:ferredoxin--NADP+ reductase